MATYKIHKDSQKKFYWILKSDKNGKTICMSSESYDSKQGAKDSIEWTKANANSARTEDLTQ
jgi:uncharacterized protein YegP (UPF0339 family)